MNNEKMYLIAIANPVSGQRPVTKFVRAGELDKLADLVKSSAGEILISSVEPLFESENLD